MKDSLLGSSASLSGLTPPAATARLTVASVSRCSSPGSPVGTLGCLTMTLDLVALRPSRRV